MSFDERLIWAVQEYPMLYDLSHKHYYNITMKESAWEDISENLNKSVRKILHCKFLVFEKAYDTILHYPVRN